MAKHRYFILLGGVLLSQVACSPLAGISTVSTTPPSADEQSAPREVSSNGGGVNVHLSDARDLHTDAFTDADFRPEIVRIIDDSIQTELFDKQAKSVNVTGRRLVTFGELRKDARFASVVLQKNANKVLLISMTGTFVVPVFSGGPGELVPKEFTRMDLTYHPETGENLGVVISP